MTARKKKRSDFNYFQEGLAGYSIFQPDACELLIIFASSCAYHEKDRSPSVLALLVCACSTFLPDVLPRDRAKKLVALQIGSQCILFARLLVNIVIAPEVYFLCAYTDWIWLFTCGSYDK
jgi:hypothetical protein